MKRQIATPQYEELDRTGLTVVDDSDLRIHFRHRRFYAALTPKEYDNVMTKLEDLLTSQGALLDKEKLTDRKTGLPTRPEVTVRPFDRSGWNEIDGCEWFEFYPTVTTAGTNGNHAQCRALLNGFIHSSLQTVEPYPVSYVSSYTNAETWAERWDGDIVHLAAEAVNEIDGCGLENTVVAYPIGYTGRTVLTYLSQVRSISEIRDRIVSEAAKVEVETA